MQPSFQRLQQARVRRESEQRTKARRIAIPLWEATRLSSKPDTGHHRPVRLMFATSTHDELDDLVVALAADHHKVSASCQTVCRHSSDAVSDIDDTEHRALQ